MGPNSQGANHFFARTHFLACKDVAGGSQQSGGRIIFLPGRTSLRAKMSLVGPSSQGETFFREIRWPVRWVPAVRWRNNYFACNKEELSLRATMDFVGSSCQALHVRWKPLLDHIDHAAPRAPGRWTTARPRKGTMRSRGRRGSGCPRVEEYEGSLVRLLCEAAVVAE